MSRDQREQAVSWLRGDLPTWLGAALVMIIAWGGRVAYVDIENTLAKAVETLHNHDTRISILEHDGKRKGP